ncbi:hypothetical protein ASE06_13255 [Sphingopyxis sp. Root214]|uniref:DUF72 domain-containing protein n=1 Tax=unclassified Sphingopyxis TaxID=2614943 RepID=UPI0006FC0877|nr:MULTISPECIES: DUF72 domain-containing protein [unclassified Sphingopyxis]KQZ73354.1 hypothetical protein ASD73_10905 [Sphingopyxis sp. Root154]KRC07500.1 hypothetical protein ASE06_13255 [Sphingopyxis sp. Root214]
MSIYVGVGGWTFEPWRGPFYPAGLAQKRELEYAGQHLTGIEINGTYYGSQKPETFANWAEAVPDGFKFSVKASRFTTNRKVLKEGAASIEKFLTQGLTRLGDRLGPIHWQFMATKKFDRDDFAGFLDLLPDTQDGLPLRHAIEVRDESFRDPAFIDMVRERNMAIVFADSDDFPCIDEQTADFTYARLQRSQEDVETGYDAKALDQWAKQARDWAKGDRDVYLFFISGAKVRNPAAAQALIAKLG